MATFAAMARVAADPSAELDEVRNPSPVIHASAALLLLLLAAALSLYKPRGMTKYGWCKQHNQRATAPT